MTQSPEEFQRMIHDAQSAKPAWQSGNRSDGPEWIWLGPAKPSTVGQVLNRHVRVLPPHPTIAPKFWFEAVVHTLYFDGSRRSKACLRVHGDGNCPVCDRQHEYWRSGKSGNVDHENRAKNLRGRQRFYFNALDMDDPASHWKKDAAGQWVQDASGAYVFQPGVLSVSKTVYDGVIMICGNKGNVTDPQHGRVLNITTRKKGPEDMQVEYHVSDIEPACPLPEGFDVALAHLVDLTKCVSVASADSLRAAVDAFAPPLSGGPVATGQAAPPAAWQQPSSQAAPQAAPQGPPVGAGNAAPPAGTPPPVPQASYAPPTGAPPVQPGPSTGQASLPMGSGGPPGSTTPPPALAQAAGGPPGASQAGGPSGAPPSGSSAGGPPGGYDANGVPLGADGKPVF